MTDKPIVIEPLKPLEHFIRKFAPFTAPNRFVPASRLKPLAVKLLAIGMAQAQPR